MEGVTQRLSGRERTFEGWAHNVSDLGVAWPQMLGLRMGQCPRLWHLGGLGGCSVDGRGPFLLPSTIDYAGGVGVGVSVVEDGHNAGTGQHHHAAHQWC